MKPVQPPLEWASIKIVLKNSPLGGTEYILHILGLVCLVALLPTHFVTKRIAAFMGHESNAIFFMDLVVLVLWAQFVLCWLLARLLYTLQVARILTLTKHYEDYQITTIEQYLTILEQMRTCNKVLGKLTGGTYVWIGAICGEISDMVIRLSKPTITKQEAYECMSDHLRKAGVFDPFHILSFYQ